MNASFRHPNLLKVEKLLADFGGFYELDDILHAVEMGDMQSFSNGESWAVTQICNFPRRKVLDILFIVGTMEELQELEAELIGFARENGCTYAMANGRLGFVKEAFDGWKMVSATFVKDLSDGT